jgi:hypothetical protein
MKKEEVMFRKVLSRRQFLERSMVGGFAAGLCSELDVANREGMEQEILRGEHHACFLFRPLMILEHRPEIAAVD